MKSQTELLLHAIELLNQDKDPGEYLKKVEQDYPGALEKQFIPQDSNLWSHDHYQQFLKERRGWIAKEINSFLQKLREHEPSKDEQHDAVNSTWLDTIKSGENNFTELSSLRYCFREEKPMDYGNTVFENNQCFSEL